MKNALKVGLLLWAVIEIGYYTGIFHQTSDADYMIDIPADTTRIPNPDTAIHYKQIMKFTTKGNNHSHHEKD